MDANVKEALEYQIFKARTTLTQQRRVYCERMTHNARRSMNVFLSTLQDELLKPMIRAFQKECEKDIEYIDTALDEIETSLKLTQSDKFEALKQVELEFHFVIDSPPPSPPQFPKYEMIRARVADLLRYENRALSEDRQLLERNPSLRQLFFYEPERGSFSLYNITNRFHQEKCELQRELPFGASAFQLEGRAYISGGRDSIDIKQMREVRKDLTELRLDGACIEHKSMKEGRHRHSITGSLQASMLLIAGGEIVSKNICKSVQIFHLQKQAWKSRVASLNQARQDHASCFIQNGHFAYIFCGTIANRNCDSLNSIERYDVGLNKWEKISSKLKKDSNVYAIHYMNESLVIYGGREKDTEVVEYEVKSGEIQERGKRAFLAGPEFMALSVGRSVYTVGRNLEDNRKKYIFKLRETGWLPLKLLN